MIGRAIKENLCSPLMNPRRFWAVSNASSRCLDIRALFALREFIDGVLESRGRANVRSIRIGEVGNNCSFDCSLKGSIRFIRLSARRE